MIIALSGFSGSGKDLVGQMIQYFTSESSKEDKFYHRDFREFVQAGGGSDLRNSDNHYYTEWEIKKFAGKLKEVASLLTGIPKHKFEDQDFKKQFLSPQWDTYSIIHKDGTEKISTKTTPHDPNNMWLVNSGKIEMHDRMTGRELLQKLGTDALRDKLHSNVWVNALFADYASYSARGSDYEEEESKWIITDCRFPNEAKAVKERDGVVVRINRPGIAAINAHPSETSLDSWGFDYVIDNDGDIEQLLAKVATLVDSVLVTS